MQTVEHTQDVNPKTDVERRHIPRKDGGSSRDCDKGDNNNNDKKAKAKHFNHVIIIIIIIIIKIMLALLKKFLKNKLNLQYM